MALLTQRWILDGIVLAISAFVALYFYMTRKFNHWKNKGVMEKKPIAFFGSFYDCLTFRKSGSQFFEDLYRDYENEKVVGFYIFDKPCLLVRDIDVANQILVKDFHMFADKHSASGDHDRLGHVNLFLLKNPHWKTLRNKLTPFFTSGKLKQMFHLMVKIGEDLDTHLDSLIAEGDGKPMEQVEIAAKYTTDIIATCAFGLQANSLKNHDAEFRQCGRTMFDFTYKRGFELGAVFYAPYLTKPFGVHAFEKSCSKFLLQVITEALSDRMKMGNRRNDLIDILIDLRDSQAQTETEDSNTFKFEGDNLTAQGAIYFTAGFKTSSIALSFALYELALQPDLQTRLRDEVTSALAEHEGQINYDWVMNLPYLDMVVSEVLRKYSVLGFIDRESSTNYKVPGTDLVIEKGTPIYISIPGFHKDPKFYPDPEKFDPERFTTENKQNRPPRAYIPFGTGPRNCIGLRFGLMTVKLALVKCISGYEFLTCKDTVIPPRMNPRSLFTETKHGIHLIVQKIDTASQ